MNEPLCSSCKFFDYDETWDGEEETGIFICHVGRQEHIGWNVEACEDYSAEKHIRKCDECGITPAYEGGVFCAYCKPETNYDQITRKTPEEFAAWLDEEYGKCEWCDVDRIGESECETRDCKLCILDWLRQEAET